MAYTEYPEVDIKTHRSLAKWNARFAAIGVFAGLYATQAIGMAEGALVVAISAVAWGAANSYRCQALRWQLEESDDSSETVREEDNR